MEVAAQLQIQESPDSSTASIWRSVSCEEKGLASAAEEIAKIPKMTSTLADNKLSDACKKLCLCAPTTHAGSFKCRLHRAIAAQKKSLESLDKSSNSRPRKTKSFTLMRNRNLDGQARLSRFGLDVAATTQPNSTALQVAKE